MRSARLATRTFATTSDAVSKRVESVTRLALRALQCGLGVDVAVLRDYDCGETATELRRVLDPRITVSELAGDQFVAVPNQLLELHRARGCWSLIASSNAWQYCTSVNIGYMLAALEEGAYATGLAIEELQQSILKGEIANTFAGYDPAKVLAVGGFHSIAADLPGKFEVSGVDEFGRPVTYRLAGVEETVTLALMALRFGKGIAPLIPEGGARYVVPDAEHDQLRYEQHLAKMGTKEVRKERMLQETGLSRSLIEGAVLDSYRVRALT
ncbi:MAG: hypothetical protein JWL82_175 [Parcubacteria group bacterium]|nr:hypothetical protein [Parcubacteria group bacterium]